MSTIYKYQILVETNKCYLKFPAELSVTLPSDSELLEMINGLRIEFSCKENPEEIVNLVFLSVDTDANVIIEDLNPKDFWPPFDEIIETNIGGEK